jgi:hypothetical protein
MLRYILAQLGIPRIAMQRWRPEVHVWACELLRRGRTRPIVAADAEREELHTPSWCPWLAAEHKLAEQLSRVRAARVQAPA